MGENLIILCVAAIELKWLQKFCQRLRYDGVNFSHRTTLVTWWWFQSVNEPLSRFTWYSVPLHEIVYTKSHQVTIDIICWTTAYKSIPSLAECTHHSAIALWMQREPITVYFIPSQSNTMLGYCDFSFWIIFVSMNSLVIWPMKIGMRIYHFAAVLAATL